MSTVMEYSPLSVGIAYLPFCAVLEAALAASAPLVTLHGHRPAACTVFALAAAELVLLSRVAAHDADALDLVPAMVLVAWPSVLASRPRISRAGSADHPRVPAGGVGHLRRHP